MHLTSEMLSNSTIDSKLHSLRKSVTCTICLEYFDNPYALPCTHCYCSQCINTHLNGNRNAYCPICKQPATLETVTFDKSVDQLVTLIRAFVECVDGTETETSGTKPKAANLGTETQGNLFFIDDLVQVSPRTWPGINKPGGVGRIVQIDRGDTDGSGELTYDVRYILDKKLDAGVPPIFIAHVAALESNDSASRSGGAAGTRMTRNRNSQMASAATSAATTPSGVVGKRKTRGSWSGNDPDTPKSPSALSSANSSGAATPAPANSAGNSADKRPTSSRKKGKSTPTVPLNISPCVDTPIPPSEPTGHPDPPTEAANTGVGSGNESTIPEPVATEPEPYLIVLTSTSVNDEKDRATLSRFCARFVTNHVPNTGMSTPVTAAFSGPGTGNSKGSSSSSGVAVVYTDNYDDSVTHLVISTLPVASTGTGTGTGLSAGYMVEKRTMKYMRAIMAGCWVLSVEWMINCLDEDRIVLPAGTIRVAPTPTVKRTMEHFEVCRFVKSTVDNAPRRARLDVAERRPGVHNAAIGGGLFSTALGCMLYGQFPHPLPSRADCMRLLGAGEAKIVPNMAIQEVVKSCIQNSSSFSSSSGSSIQQGTLAATDPESVKLFLAPRIVIVCPDAASCAACRAEFTQSLRSTLHVKPVVEGSRDSVSVTSKLQFYNKMIVVTTYIWVLDCVSNYELRPPLML